MHSGAGMPRANEIVSTVSSVETRKARSTFAAVRLRHGRSGHGRGLSPRRGRGSHVRDDLFEKGWGLTLRGQTPAVQVRAPKRSATSCATSVGVVPTSMSTASSASFFACAVPAEPEMIAPACPIVLPGGAEKPAM